MNFKSLSMFQLALLTASSITDQRIMIPVQKPQSMIPNFLTLINQY